MSQKKKLGYILITVVSLVAFIFLVLNMRSASTKKKLLSLDSENVGSINIEKAYNNYSGLDRDEESVVSKEEFKLILIGLYTMFNIAKTNIQALLPNEDSNIQNKFKDISEEWFHFIFVTKNLVEEKNNIFDSLCRFRFMDLRSDTVVPVCIKEANKRIGDLHTLCNEYMSLDLKRELFKRSIKFKEGRFRPFSVVYAYWFIIIMVKFNSQ